MTWELTPLKKITTKIGSGATPRGGNNSYKTEGITLIRSLNVHDFEFRYEGLAFINEEQASDTRLARASIKPKDILLNLTGASVARCCIVPEHLLPARVNQHVSLVRVDPNLADSHYVLYCINSPVYKRQLLTLAQGGATREALTQKIIGNLEIPLPPIPTQRKIANFLDRKTQQINELIRIKERQIELLQEQRTALINQAVTKGLDPNVELKPTGVEWIGEIPTHWTISKVKHEFQSLDNLRIPLNAETRGSMKLKVYDYYGASGVIDKVESYIFDEPLILIGEDGANLYLRSTPLAFKATGKYWVNNHAHVLRPKHGNIDYLTNMLESLDYTHYITGAAQPKLTSEHLMNIAVISPPTSEQDQIADFLNRKTQQIDELLTTEQRKIELLKEYRQSLISEVVTGKIDVRVDTSDESREV